MESAAVERSQSAHTVSSLVALLNSALESEVGTVSFLGEIGQLKRAASGHLYFTIKDEEAEVSAVMWRGLAAQLRFQPDAGLEVRCLGKPGVYPRTGRLQMVVQRMELGGEGALLRRFEQLKQKLEREGLFAESRKRELPLLPQSVVVITSPTGAVIHDIEVKVRERFPGMQLKLIPVRVQGPGAAEEIAEAVRWANEHKIADVVVVARGGGSLADLWPFNEEVVVRALFASSIPVVSGVGHETDTTLADLAADLRCPTPTAAAERVVPEQARLIDSINDLERRLSDLSNWLEPRAQEIDDLSERLSRALTRRVEQSRLVWETSRGLVQRIRPDRLVGTLRARVDVLAERLNLRNMVGRLRELERDVEGLDSRLGSACTDTIRARMHRVESLEGRLHGLNPKAVLQRGFAIVHIGEEQVITKASHLKLDDQVGIEFVDGAVQARVLEEGG